MENIVPMQNARHTQISGNVFNVTSASETCKSPKESCHAGPPGVDAGIEVHQGEGDPSTKAPVCQEYTAQPYWQDDCIIGRIPECSWNDRAACMIRRKGEVDLAPSSATPVKRCTRALQHPFASNIYSTPQSVKAYYSGGGMTVADWAESNPAVDSDLYKFYALLERRATCGDDDDCGTW